MAIVQTERFNLFQWTQASDQFTRLQLQDSHSEIEDNLGIFTEDSSTPSLPDSSQARSFHHDTSTDQLYFSHEGTTWRTVIHEIEPVEIGKAQTLTNKTLTSPTISSIKPSASHLLSLPSATDTLATKTATEDLSNKTYLGCVFQRPKLIGMYEKWNYLTTSLSSGAGSQNIDVATSGAWFFAYDSTTNISVNIRSNSTSALSTVLAQGRTMTVAVAMTNGSTAHYVSSMLIDGVSQAVKWADGTIPTSGNANGVDLYLFTIHRKTGVTPSYTVLGQVNQFV